MTTTIEVTCPECGETHPLRSRSKAIVRNRCRGCAQRASVRDDPSRTERRQASLRARMYAVDDLVVDFLTEGIRMPSTRGERQAAAAILIRRGLMTHQIADRLGVTRRSVARYRAALQ